MPNSRPSLRRRSRRAPLLASVSVTLFAATVTALSPSGASATVAGSVADPVADADPAIALLASRMDDGACAVTGSRLSPVASAARAASEHHLGSSALVDPSLRLSPCGRAYFADATYDRTAAPSSARPAQTTPVTSLANTFTLSSRPAAARTIYLDFNGARLTDTAWNQETGEPVINVAPYSSDSSISTSFSDTELAEIQRVWQAVSEDYAPFDVNVTTKDPGPDAIFRDNKSDAHYGSHMLFTADNVVEDYCGGCGGIAFVGTYNYTGTDSELTQPGFVFTTTTYGLPKMMADAASHEVGHQIGLAHDGRKTSNGRVDYYMGEDPWAPIMGASYYQPVAQWSKGEYSGATNTEDDLSIIASQLPLIADDQPNTIADASTELVPAGQTKATTTGLISINADQDLYALSVDEPGTTVSVSVTPADPNTSLDVRLALLDADGAILSLSEPTTSGIDEFSASGLDASITDFTLPEAGRYFVAVAGDGQGSASVGYTGYGAIGTYRITASVSQARTYIAPTITGSLPSGRKGRAYSSTVTAVDGEPSMQWRIAKGSLPPGLRLRTSSGEKRTVTFYGKPKKTGTFAFTLLLTDQQGTQVTRAYAIRIR